MTSEADSSTPMARLLERRELSPLDLSQRAGVGAHEVRAFLDGATPNPLLLRQLASTVDLHAADLFVIAGLPVPDDLAPLDAAAGRLAATLAGHAIQLPASRRHQLCQAVRSMPQKTRTQPVPPLPLREQYPPGPGGMILRMLRNRNLDWIGSAKCLAQLTPHYLAASTLGMIGHGRKEVSPDLLVSFAALLAVRAEDLAALTNIVMPREAPSINPAASDAAQLIWDIRRLTASQTQQILDEAESMLAAQETPQRSA
ncbi:XRE family transcriptional regulator [Micromonospora sp. WMMD712]|uniref:XRE family transcriptional regulator n=1 Tax=Micromonospora sp. WMMD712 TaxID=3016096 RepID=UPI00249CAD27|nr:XRE family transcriptional regulator [Micromonospora sp. WMMD712]WFE57578.1 XRE family transcriptional regulator [Micromonospora sp. WMMD712]